MSLDEFLNKLHFDIEGASVPNWEVDWDDAPLPYKLYRGLPVVPLSVEVPLELLGSEPPTKPLLKRIGHFLWYVFGLTQFSQSVNSTDIDGGMIHSYRRFVPSGGALYPNELYIYLKLDDLPVGVYHYDAAHHRLVLLREGNFDSYLGSALGNRCDVSSCFGTVFVSVMFWKNYFKYNNFSYRLQGLDTGVVIGQLLEASERFGFESGVYFQFLDRAMNHLLGLDVQEESVYAIIPLSVEPTNWSASGSERDINASELCRELKEIQPKHFMRSRNVKQFPMLTKMNEASIFDSTKMFRYAQEPGRLKLEGTGIEIPQMNGFTYDLASVCRKRLSPDMDFVLGKISLEQLAILLQFSSASMRYRNDLDCAYSVQEPRVSLYGCFYNVDGLPDGAYFYENSTHELRQVDSGDFRLVLQSGLSLDNVNLHQVPLCLHVVGERDSFITPLGYRGYRIQQMEAGMLVQSLLLTASAVGMGGHPLLGFDANMSDEIYGLVPLKKTSLIQIPIGPFRHRPWLKGSLHT
jgi:SagB-type dehydrogenase family enzyme